MMESRNYVAGQATEFIKLMLPTDCIDAGSIIETVTRHAIPAANWHSVVRNAIVTKMPFGSGKRMIPPRRGKRDLHHPIVGIGLVAVTIVK
jgi:hypothetical protein